MTGVEMLAVGVRVLGMYFLIQFFVSLSGWVGLWIRHGRENPWAGEAELIIYGVSTLWLLLVFVLLKWPLRIARWLFPSSSPEGQRLSLSAFELQAVLLAVLGAWIVVMQTPLLVRQIALLWLDPVLATGAERTSAIVSLVTLALRVGIGIFLCLRAPGISRMLVSLRGGGVRQPLQ